MKKYVILTYALLPILLVGVTRTVSLDGTQQYTSIQTAINASYTGDVILVYPGRYIENINLNSHSNITIAGLYYQSPQQVYIDSTIIDGNLNTCIKAENGETFRVNGLTFVNNEQNTPQVWFYNGGAINLYENNNLTISNCVVRNCYASNGGAISADMNSIVHLSNVVIHDNIVKERGGGIALCNNSSLIWDTAHPSKVYNNLAPWGMDFWMEYCANTVNIQLQMGSQAMNQADSYYINYRVNNCPAPNVSISQGIYTPIDHDIYVSPNGNDNNNGLSAASPFKTVLQALRMIAPNPNNPQTIHLAPGTYSPSLNEQVFNISLKPYIKVTGAGTNETIFDGELQTTFIGGFNTDGVSVSGIKFINARSNSIIAPLDFERSSDIVISDLIFDNCNSANASGIILGSCSNVMVQNIVAGNLTSDEDMITMAAGHSDNIYVNNFVSYNNTLSGTDSDMVGFYINSGDVIIRNSIIANNQATDAYVLYYQNIDSEYAENTLEMSNVLISNNTITDLGWAFAPVYLQNRFQPVKINNCTFAGNRAVNSALTRIFCYADISNLISYNPLSANEMILNNHIFHSETGQFIDADVSVRNSLFGSTSIPSDLPNLVSLTGITYDRNPRFLGSIDNTISVSDPEYYYLSGNSLCIDAGTADTIGLNLPMTDLAGNRRVWNNRIDMGCYEYGAPPVENDDQMYPITTDKVMICLYPNPVFLNSSKGGYSFIEFTLPEKTKEKPVIVIYNLKGQKVRSMELSDSYNSLVQKAGLKENYEMGGRRDISTGKGACIKKQDNSQNRQKAELQTKSGEFYSTVFDSRDDHSQRLAAGIYIVKVTAGQYHAAAKMTILK